PWRPYGGSHSRRDVEQPAVHTDAAPQGQPHRRPSQLRLVLRVRADSERAKRPHRCRTSATPGREHSSCAEHGCGNREARGRRRCRCHLPVCAREKRDTGNRRPVTQKLSGSHPPRIGDRQAHQQHSGPRRSRRGFQRTSHHHYVTMSTPISSDADYTSALATAATYAERSLDDARIPIHILLTAQFGELNDNQEEMLRDAAAALDNIAEELHALRDIASADQAVATARRDVVRIGEILRALQPELLAQASRADVSLIVNIAPGLPSTIGAFTQLRDAIRLTLADDIRYAIPGSTVTIDAVASADEIRITSCCGAPRSVSVSLLLAE